MLILTGMGGINLDFSLPPRSVCRRDLFLFSVSLGVWALYGRCADMERISCGLSNSKIEKDNVTFLV